MKHQWLAQTGTNELILVFGGWALGAAPFVELFGDQDVLLVDGYTTLDTNLPDLTSYGHISLIAFSFGVASAVHWLRETGFIPNRLIAVSGTFSPADATHGIAPAMIRATAENLTPSSFAKFCRRAGLEPPAPALDVEAAKAELLAVIQRGPAPTMKFDRIWVPDQDRIIPTQAQHAAWATQQQAIRSLPGPHVPFRKGQTWAEWLT